MDVIEFKRHRDDEDKSSIHVFINGKSLKKIIVAGPFASYEGGEDADDEYEGKSENLEDLKEKAVLPCCISLMKKYNYYAEKVEFFDASLGANCYVEVISTSGVVGFVGCHGVGWCIPNFGFVFSKENFDREIDKLRKWLDEEDG